MTDRELVVLLADDGTPTGTAPKATVHSTDTPLHLAFSCFLYDTEGRILLTRRALSKKTWPGVWTNSFCGHPGPDEPFDAAIERRAHQELGTRVRDIAPVVPDFRYRAVDASGVVENEVCPVYTATLDGELVPVPDEVMETAWIAPADLDAALEAAPFAFSPWMYDEWQAFRSHQV
ncbi:isopentenyl-diphosphate Delta-isomerase [Brevibacterium litoralis]|uniref:isopentenyl-diphosphate Delta-isomerase n=1 Tax=Brevibacterium litoralis TaxID=3138935 RepID=UPI0032EEDE29